MNTVLNKAIVIAVAIFVTIAVASGILFTINQIQQIYKQVYETDTAISNRFTEFDAYDGSQKTTLDIINTYNKYKNNSQVTVKFNGVNISDAKIINDSTEGKINLSTYNLSEKFNSTLTINAENVTIEFNT